MCIRDSIMITNHIVPRQSQLLDRSDVIWMKIQIIPHQIAQADPENGLLFIVLHLIDDASSEIIYLFFRVRLRIPKHQYLKVWILLFCIEREIYFFRKISRGRNTFVFAACTFRFSQSVQRLLHWKRIRLQFLFHFDR